MNRRDFLQLKVASGFGHGLLGAMPAYGDHADRKLDRFGGWRHKKFKATGFFRVEKDERWLLVTPEGNAFLSFGINHLHPGWWRQDYNREAWEERLGLNNLNSPGFGPALRAWFRWISVTE